MSVSYSGLRNYGKATLGSVESWGTNNNILKDPPRGIYTRKINRVGFDSEITEAIDASENRNAECIKVYARSTNPHVSVMYQNANNSNSGSSSNTNQTPASLPYKLSDSFRPPVQSQYQLQPLSRQPRIWTSAWSQPGFTDFSKKINNCGCTDIKYTIKPLETSDVQTNIRAPYDITTQEVMTPHKFRDTGTLSYEAHTNPSSSCSNGTLIGEFELPTQYTHDRLKGDFHTAKRGYSRTNFMHDQKELERKHPLTEGFTNRSGVGDNAVSGRERKILQKPGFGGYEARAQMPSIERVQELYRPFETQKASLGKTASDQFFDRCMQQHVY